MIRFRDTYNDAMLYRSVERYHHYHTPSQLLKYYANYFEYKAMPTLELFLGDERSQKKFHGVRNQKHLLFIFPENEVIPEDIKEYALAQGYTHEKMELYQVDVSRQNVSEMQDDTIEIVEVDKDDEVFKDFLDICYQSEVEYGEAFAQMKSQVHRNHLNMPNIIQYVAYKDEVPVGKLQTIINPVTVELDDFFVLESYRKQGIGTALQHYVWQSAGGRPVILVADGNDSPREMYQRQGYVRIAVREELLRTGEAE